MDFAKYQELASSTDQVPMLGDDQDLDKSMFTPLFGLAGEAGSLLTEYKKKLRDGDSYVVFKERVSEEIGDILWYLANIASKENLDLNEIAESNIYKVKNRWLALSGGRSDSDLLDSEFPKSEQFPRSFKVKIDQIVENERIRVELTNDGEKMGNDLTDNAYEDDGYRFHDVFHLAYVTYLGWSPVGRKLFQCKRASDPTIDEVEDGGRAKVIDEAISALVFDHARQFGFYRHVESVEFELLKIIKSLTSHLEVSVRTPKDWEIAILEGYRVWNEIREKEGGYVVGDLIAKTFEFEEK
jgi:NTP pyrophosphatase (non-canonical NTP hydrolase)